MSTTAGRLADFASRLDNLKKAQKVAAEKQKPKGKNAAMDRIQMLIDPGTALTATGAALRQRHWQQQS